MQSGHHNLCLYAEDEQSLYKLWNDDLKRAMRRRGWYEAIGAALLLGSFWAWHSGNTDTAFMCAILAVGFLYSAIKFMVDESNTNYLMHHWDLRVEVERLRFEERRRMHNEI
jgi:hypothetical protein